ncbi:MAG: hypothetical protein OEM00_10925 [Burkholderiaceae bacterium]|nr:hypothetical protein [Burkholderiaceae bacterium]
MNESERVESCRLALLRSCHDCGAWVSGDGRCTEETAASLLGLSPGTLCNKRSEGSAPPHYRLGGGGSRVSYSLNDLARWIVSHRCE